MSVTTLHLRLVFFFKIPAPEWVSQYYTHIVARQNEGGTEWVELFIMLTRGMGEPMYGLLLSPVDSWWDVLGGWE